MEDTYEITYDVLLEYISYCKLEMGRDIVEHLASLKCDIEHEATRRVLDSYIEKYGEEYEICTECFSYLEPYTIKEKHGELDYPIYETVVDKYVCEGCGKVYKY